VDRGRDLDRRLSDRRTLEARFAEAAGTDLRRGMVAALHTASSDSRWHPRVHALAYRGGWDSEGEWHAVPYVDESAEELSEPEPRITLEILDATGETVQELEDLPLQAGLNRVHWNLAEQPTRPRSDEPQSTGFFGFAPRGPMVLPGEYRARLRVDDRVHEQTIVVRVDPELEIAPGD
jgi:hypothetical protein